MGLPVLEYEWRIGFLYSNIGVLLTASALVLLGLVMALAGFLNLPVLRKRFADRKRKP
jgi:hypothetical protein